MKTKSLQRPTDTICLNAVKAKIVEEGRIETYSCDNLTFQVSTPLKLKKTLISLTKDCDDSLSSISIDTIRTKTLLMLPTVNLKILLKKYLSFTVGF